MEGHMCGLGGKEGEEGNDAIIILNNKIPFKVIDKQ